MTLALLSVHISSIKEPNEHAAHKLKLMNVRWILSPSFSASAKTQMRENAAETKTPTVANNTTSLYRDRTQSSYKVYNGAEVTFISTSVL